jgi:hypothetical protein
MNMGALDTLCDTQCSGWNEGDVCVGTKNVVWYRKNSHSTMY